MIFGNNISLNNNELQNVVLQKLAADPSPVTAKIYYNTVSNVIRYYNGTTWGDIGAGGSGDVVGPVSSVDGQIALFDGVTGKLLEAATTTGLLKATSGVLAAAVEGTDYLTAASSNTLTNKTFDANGTGNSITNIETTDFAANVVDNDSTLTANSATRLPTQQAVKTYVDSLVEGIDWKDAVRVATTVTGVLATAYENGDTVDGIVLATGDRILIKDQSTQTENGIYIVQATGAPIRSTDANTGNEIWSAAVYVREGTANAGSNWVNNNTTAITIGATNITFAQFQGQVQPDATTTTKGIVELATLAEAEAKSSSTLALTPASVANFPVKKTFTIGDTVATSFPLTHNLNTQDLTVSIRKVSTNEHWMTTVQCNTVNQVTLTFAVAPTASEFVVTIIG